MSKIVYWEGTTVPRRLNRGPLVFEDNPYKTPIPFRALFHAFFGVRQIEESLRQSFSPQEGFGRTPALQDTGK
jgi:hypothetical protein